MRQEQRIVNDKDTTRFLKRTWFILGSVLLLTIVAMGGLAALFMALYMFTDNIFVLLGIALLAVLVGVGLFYVVKAGANWLVKQ